MTYITQHTGFILIHIHVQPNASKSEVSGIHGDHLKVRIKAPANDGKANLELINFISKKLSVPKSSIELVKGLTGRKKTIRINGINSGTFLFHFPAD